MTTSTKLDNRYPVCHFNH